MHFINHFTGHSQHLEVIMPQQMQVIQRGEDLENTTTLEEGIRKNTEEHEFQLKYMNLENLECHVGDQRIIGSTYSLKRRDMILKGDTIYNREVQSFLWDILIDEYGYMKASKINK